MNEQKRTIKNQGIFVDGIKVNIEFDGKMFLLVYCMKVVCKNNPDVTPDETCPECLQNKCNRGRYIFSIAFHDHYLMHRLT